ncbi:MAG: SH3 domain-containing protein [Kangiellaceae bacterium]|nr:SH3 domain-containing protein [Kangiellaceae bacterium]
MIQATLKFSPLLAVAIGLSCFNQFCQSEPKAALQGNYSTISDVEGIKEKMLYPDYWQDKTTNSQASMLSSREIEQLNRDLFSQHSFMNELSRTPETINKKELIDKINAISQIPKTARYYSDGREVKKDNYAEYVKALNILSLTPSKNIDMGMVVRRTNMRTFPTTDSVFKTASSFNLDRFQETALFPTQVVAIYHQSLDNNWLFVSSYNYSAWVKKEDIAVGSRNEIFDYKESAPFLVITGDKINTTFNPYTPAISEVQLDMGIRIPLVANKDKPSTIGGQNTYASHVINLPVRGKDSKLEFKAALIPKSKDVNIGYLPFNQENIIQQSFKFLGERYGWGHSFNARDCTGFVGEIYKSFGILMPRNSGQQGKSSQGQNIRFSKSASNNEKLAEINKLDVGDLLYIPGHVMIYLGQENNKPYIIHDVSGMSYFKNNGEYYKSSLNGVSVTPLLPLQLNQETTYLDRIYNLKKIK